MKNKKFFAAFCICACFIWINSLLPAEQSGNLSDSLSYQLYHMLHLSIDFDLFHLLIRKGAHFSEFAILGILASLSFQRIYWFEAILLCVLTACMDETIQLFVAGRSSQITDVMIDSSGVLCSFFIIFLITKYLINKRRNIK